MIAPEQKRGESVQAMMTREEAARVRKMAEDEGWPLSYMARTLILESLMRWEKSAPGRRRRKA